MVEVVEDALEFILMGGLMFSLLVIFFILSWMVWSSYGFLMVWVSFILHTALVLLCCSFFLDFSDCSAAIGHLYDFTVFLIFIVQLVWA